ncbi:MAG: restriction endonuclease subunit S [Rubrivivax sp.]|nr:restriction endonuclease subunit S [Pyrinomonadaceae bacterium]
MKSQLRDIANIRSGYPFRGRVEPALDGEFRVVQIKDISQNARLESGDMLRIDLPDVRHDYLLKTGDVLFASRGTRKQAVVIDDDLENTTFGTQFFAIEARDGVLPAYLAWYINQQPAQRYLEEHSMGSNVRIVTKEALSRMPIQMPPLDVQRKVVEVHRLSLKEKELMRAIETKRSQLVETALLGIIESKIK